MVRLSSIKTCAMDVDESLLVFKDALFSAGDEERPSVA
jgi:hypothetical protein